MNSKTDSVSPAADASVAESAVPAGLPVDHVVWDKLGIVGSALCVVHCVFTPLAIGYLSAMGLGFLGAEVFHKLLAVPLLAIALLAFLPGYRKHGDTRILAAGIAAVAVLLGAIFVLETFLPHSIAAVGTVIGSVLLIGAHALNWRKGCGTTECCSPAAHT